MNLFCFSLEGSMDSLYEAVHDSSDAPPRPIPSRSSSRACSPAFLLDDNAKWQHSGRSISMEMPQIHGATLNKKKRRTHISKSASDNETLDHPSSNTNVWQATRSRDDLVHIPNSHHEEIKKTKHKSDTKGGKGAHHAGTKKKEKSSSNQSLHSKGVNAECKSGNKRSQKSTRKPGVHSGREGSKKCHNSIMTPPPGTTLDPHRLDVPYGSDRMLYLGKSSTLPTQENAMPGRCTEKINLPGGATPTHHQRWSNPGDTSPSWGVIQHTCQRPLTEYRVFPHDLNTTKGKEHEGRHLPPQDGSLKRERKPQIPPKVPRSMTDVNLSEPNRSRSFGKFEGLKHQSSPVKADENETTTLTEECDSLDPNKATGLGKKLKAISLTMRRKMGKKHANSLSEEMGDEDPEAETDRVPTAENNPTKSSNSLESLCSGQSSSSGVTSESNGSGQRNSVGLDEDGPFYQGQFSGRARVHTDFVPSPYDTDSLKLKVGDIINIISKPPMGIWTGMLNNKVGNFKFIYVDIIVEKEKEEEVPKIRTQKLCRRPPPKNLLELLERLNLEEYASALLLNGYQTVEDLMHLQEKHLIELNIKDPEHRRSLLAAAEFHYTEGEDVRDSAENQNSNSQQEEDSDCPRDSGCFIPSECSESKEDQEQATQALDSLTSLVID